MPPALTLAVVGADHPNKRGPGRRFEIALCKPGESIDLRAEPKNPADPRAVAVYSCRGVQLGYVTAERAPLIGPVLADARAIFQAATEWGALVRVTFDGNEPDLPPEPPSDGESQADPDSGFYPDWTPPDE